MIEGIYCGYSLKNLKDIVYIGITKLDVRDCITEHESLGQKFKDLTIDGMFLSAKEAEDWQKQSLIAYSKNNGGTYPKYNKSAKKRSI